MSSNIQYVCEQVTPGRFKTPEGDYINVGFDFKEVQDIRPSKFGESDLIIYRQVLQGIFVGFEKKE